MRCPACGAENLDNDRFCTSCGGPLAPTCPACGAAVGSQSRFCGKCGAPVGALTARGPGAPGGSGPNPVPSPVLTGPGEEGTRGPPGEVRHVSVLFCDLVGYTSLAEPRDPEEVRELLSGYFDLARAIVGRYGGVVEKFIGDAVMAVWGAPIANEDDAERAVRAGLELVSAVPGYGASAGSELACRVGIATGAAATTESPSEGLVIGDRVNTAARIQGEAEPGACYVDQVTKRLSEASIAFEDEGLHELKGKSEPELLYRAARVLSGVGGRLRSDALEAPLVGRETELRTLKDLFHASADRQSPRLVVVAGPAGVGKSRLGFEFERYVDGLVETVLWHRGRCLSYGEGVSFWAPSESVRQRLGIAEDDAAEAARTKLTEGLVRLVGEDERDYVGARLARLLGIELGGGRQQNLPREELFAGWRLFFERLAAVAPVVLLVEDAQHSDADLLGFLDHLVDWARGLPIFVFVLARPELAEAHPGFGVGRNRSTLSLDPLDRSSMDDLIEALVPGMPSEARAAVTSRAEGIPLFAVETVRSLIDAGSVVREGGTHRLAGELGELSVPDSLHSLLASRLDALDPATRSLVGLASVLGSSFSAEALVAVSGREPDEVRAELSELVGRNVLEVIADHLSPQRGDYRFAQEMLREVAYEGLSRRDRKSHHLAVAAHLRRSYPNEGEEMAEVIARHYTDALAAGPDATDAGSIREEGLSMLVRAAERAKRAGAPAQAALSYAAAAGLLAGASPESSAEPGSGPATPGGACEERLRGARLLEEAARAAITAGSYERAIAHAESARAVHLAEGETRAAARARTLASGALSHLGRLADARSELVEALGVLRAKPDADTVDAVMQLARVEIFAGSPGGDRLSEEALLMGQALAVSTSLLSELLVVRATALDFSDREAESVALMREGARLSEAAGAAEIHSRALLNLASLTRSSDPAGALQAARASASEAVRVGNPDLLAVATSNCGVALLELGEWDQAVATLDQAVEEGAGDHFLIAYLRVLLAGLRGDGEDAAGRYAALFDSIGGTEDRQDAATLSLAGAFAATAEGRSAEALGHALSAVRQAEAIGIRHEVVCWAWPLAARLARALEDGAATGELLAMLDARPLGHLPPLLRAERLLAAAHAAADPDSFADAVVALRDVGSPYHLAHGLLDEAGLLVRAGDATAAEAAVAAIEEARLIGERLGCPPLVERAESLRSELAGVA